jgi:hypothetical protein
MELCGEYSAGQLTAWELREASKDPVPSCNSCKRLEEAYLSFWYRLEIEEQQVA